MLNEFVEKILVHEADYSSGERVQDVEISIPFLLSDLSMRMVHGQQNQEKSMSLTQTVTGYPMPAEKAIKAGK